MYNNSLRKGGVDFGGRNGGESSKLGVLSLIVTSVCSAIILETFPNHICVIMPKIYWNASYDT